MSRYIRKLVFCFAAAVLFASAEKGIALGENKGTGEPAISPGICGEEEYVLLFTENNHAEIYDSQGSYVGKCRALLDEYRWAATVPKNGLISYSDGTTWTVFAMAEQKVIFEMPAEDGSCYVSGDVFLVENSAEGTVSLYDSRGKNLCSIGNGEWTGTDSFGRLLELDNGYVVGLSAYGDAVYAPEISPVWVSKDGIMLREITDPMLVDAYAQNEVSPFGNYLEVRDWEAGVSRIYDLDGNLLLDGVETCTYQWDGDNWIYDYGVSRPALAIVGDGESYIVYDTDLQLYATIPISEGPYLDYTDGYLVGKAYPELDGNICAGMVQYGGEEWCPYARTTEGSLVLLHGQLVLVPTAEGQTLSGFNPAYLSLEESDEADNYTYSCVERSSGETLVQSFWEEERYCYYALGADYCLTTECEGEQQTFTVRNASGEISFSSENARCDIWKNGYLSLERGVYRGIADVEGNWVIRTFAGWSE